MEVLIQLLQSIRPLPDEVHEHLLEIIQSKTIKKKEFLLKAGRINDQIYFIEKGLLRGFRLEHQQEICSWFMKEGDFVIAVESFYDQMPSTDNIEAIEDTSVVYISHKNLQAMYQKFPEFNFTGRILSEKYYLLSEKRLSSMRLQRSLDRYDYFMKHHPELVRRVPAKYIASYLGITLETLSRIKKR